jgi:tripartite-type tricarboxylate transporter receptor subunit TctC
MQCKQAASYLSTLLTALAIGFSGSAFAAYPESPITIVAQQPPGSGSDAMTRVLADCLAKQLKQPVVVQNKAGANGILAINYLKGQPANGYTLMTIGMSQMTITPYVYKKMPYDPQADFTGVTVFGTSPLVLTASLNSGVKVLGDLAVKFADKDGGANFGSPGKGSPAHLLTTALLKRLNVPGTHVPFTGESAGATALIGNQIDIMTLVSGTALPQIKAGKLVPLAVFDGARSPAFPEVPTIAELLGDQELARGAWIGLVAIKNTPAPIVQTLNQAASQCIQDPAYVKRFAQMNAKAIATSATDVISRAKADSDVWRPLIKSLNLTVD